MGHIFVSYSHKDTEFAHSFSKTLQNMGFEVWIDERLDYGSQWPNEIQKQLDSCDAFILIMSPRSFASEWVQSELQRAKRKLKPIFPLLLDGNEPWLSVESTQYYDVRGGKLPDNKFYSALKRVISVSHTDRTFSGMPKPVQKPEYFNSKSKISGTLAVLGGIAAIICVCITGVFFVRLLTDNNNSQTGPSITATLSTPFETITPAEEISPTYTLVSSTISPIPPTLTPTFTPTVTPSTVPTLAPVIKTKTYQISQTGGTPNTQSSTPLDFTIEIDTISFLQVQYEVTTNCSDINLRILLDGTVIHKTGFLGPVSKISTTGLVDLSHYVLGGKYKFRTYAKQRD